MPAELSSRVTTLEAQMQSLEHSVVVIRSDLDNKMSVVEALTAFDEFKDKLHELTTQLAVLGTKVAIASVVSSFIVGPIAAYIVVQMLTP